MIPGEHGEEYPEFEPHCYHCKHYDGDYFCNKKEKVTSVTDTCEQFDGGQAYDN